jgi:flagellar basal-body rod protein FlgB
MSAHTQVGLLAKLLDVTHARHEVIARNVANVNTPGYRRQDVQFEQAFAKALTSGPSGAALAVQPKIVLAAGGVERRDGNNVDIDWEMGQLAKNSLLYKVYAQVLAVQLAQMRSAVSGR